MKVSEYKDNLIIVKQSNTYYVANNKITLTRGHDSIDGAIKEYEETITKNTRVDTKRPRAVKKAKRKPSKKAS